MMINVESYENSPDHEGNGSHQLLIVGMTTYKKMAGHRYAYQSMQQRIYPSKPKALPSHLMTEKLCHHISGKIERCQLRSLPGLE
jgi:hypothetical protein